MLKECSPASSSLLYQRATANRAAFLMVFFENIIRREWHRPYAILMSGYSQNSTAALCFRLSVHLSADLKSKCRERISNSLRVSPLEYRYGTWSSSLCLASSISSLACRIASRRCLMRNSRTASQANFRMWKRSIMRLASGNAARTILRIESERSSVNPLTA